MDQIHFRSFYNTIHEEGEERLESEIKAQEQEKVIARLFELYPDRKLAPHEVHALLWGSSNVPITSVRRAMTNLTDQGFLWCVFKILGSAADSQEWASLSYQIILFISFHKR